MKNLLRMSLFIIARAGLCLAVVAWIVGQWWTLDAVVSWSGVGIGLKMTNGGWVAVHRERWAGTRFSVTDAATDRTHFIVDGSPVHTGVENAAFVDSRALAANSGQIGEIRVHLVPNGHFVSSRHWLTVTLFALFYGVLKWVYRKRGKRRAKQN